MNSPFAFSCTQDGGASGDVSVINKLHAFLQALVESKPEGSVFGIFIGTAMIKLQRNIVDLQGMAAKSAQKKTDLTEDHKGHEDGVDVMVPLSSNETRSLRTNQPSFAASAIRSVV